MVIGTKELLKLVKEKKLVEDLSERELTNPEGAGFDLCLGKVHEISGRAFMGLEERESAKSKLIREFKKDKKQSIIIKPGKGYLVTTVEKVNMPDNITANMTLRGTLYRSGIILSCGNIAPGYQGELSVTLYNSGRADMEIELGARILHIQFSKVTGSTNLYRGQWQGGRVATKKREVQV